MGIDDFIKDKHHSKSSRHYHDDHDHEEYHGRYNHHDDQRFNYKDHHHHGGGHRHGSYKLELLRSVLHSIPNRKTILTVALIACAVLLIIIAALLWAVFPLIMQAVGYVEENGIKGVVDSLLPYVDKLWKGNG